MEVILNNQIIPIIVIHKKIKNIYFRFDENLNLVVSANKYASNKEILSLINKNQKSLEKMLEKLMKRQVKKNEFWYLGNKYEVIYDGVSSIIFDDGKIICKNEDSLNKFIKRQVKEIFTREVEKLKQIIKTPEFTLRFRKMKTRWGVCNYKLKTITLNTELIRYDIEDLRYVIVHEMCHFYHHNHGEAFWQMVGKYYPHYKEARKDLRE